MMRQILNNKRGFTLLEVLVVLALTMLVMGLVFGPLLNSFKLTHQAEVMIRAQDNARLALSQVSRDLNNAMYIYDNYNPSYWRETVREDQPDFDFSNGTPPELKDTVRFPMIDADKRPVDYYFMYAKVDMVMPRMRGYCPNDPKHTVGGVEVGDESEPKCTQCGTELEIKPLQPLTPDTTRVVRYFIGLRDPAQNMYANGYENTLSSVKYDNMYVLYRVEFDPADNELFPPLRSGETIRDRIADPDFFYRQPYASKWKKISRPVVTLQDTDLIRFERDKDGEVKYIDGKPSFSPTVTFAPTAVFNDPLEPTSDETDDPEHGGSTAPTVYKASYGHWVLPYEVVVEPEGKPNYVFKTHSGYGTGAAPADPPTDMCVYRVPRGSSGGDLVFNISQYQRSGAITPIGVGGEQRAFNVDTVRGVVNFSFPVVTSRVQGMAVSKSEPADAIELRASNFGDRKMFLDASTDSKLMAATVVPSSVKVIAPDTRPQSFGQSVFYTRVPFLNYDIGPNQFSVDPYDTNPENNRSEASVSFFTLHTPGHNIGPELPMGDVLVYYEAQNNKKGDSLRANYTTKSLMTVTMGIRIYSKGTGRARPEAVELVNKINLKNIKT